MIVLFLWILLVHVIFLNNIIILCVVFGRFVLYAIGVVLVVFRRSKKWGVIKSRGYEKAFYRK